MPFFSSRPTIFCDDLSVNARAILSDLDADFSTRPDRADLIWMRKGYKPMQPRLRRHQLLNHIPDESAMVNKGRLTEHLKAFDGTQTDGSPALRDFCPETYRLYDDAERAAFFAQLPERDVRDNLWILKPDDLSRGRGVKILWQFDRLRRMYDHPEDIIFDPQIERGRDYIIQRYIRNPLLLDGRKSEIRLYWLIACLDPLLVLLYREGTVRLNSRPFRLADFDDTLIHVTNVYQQKSHPDYDPSLTLKWRFSRLQSYLTDDLKLAGPDFIEAHLKPQFKRHLEFVVRATGEALASTPTQGLHFGLYGADLILDDALRPWLTEIQKGPGLSYDDPVKAQVIPPMLREAARIALEVQARKRTGQPLMRLDSVDGFEWVIDEA